MTTATLVNCPYCHGAIRAGDTRAGCPVCRAVYHEACWQHSGRCCAVLGCSGSGASLVMAPLAVDAPAVAAETITVPMMNTTMVKAQSGLVDCPHCKGETVCKVTDNSSCAYCLAQHKQWSGVLLIVICSVCKGKGQITIAPGLAACPHCRGSTWCKHGMTGSCPNCLPSQAQENYLELKRWPSVAHVAFALGTLLNSSPTRCSICQGVGHTAFPDNVQVCRHCNGATVCRRGSGGQVSCDTCVTDTRTKTKVTVERAQPVMCSICKGHGYIAG